MSTDAVIPMFPAISFSETLDFYRALGFEVTFEQTTPYEYGAVQRNGVALNFYGGFKGVVREKSYASCLVMVDDLAGTHTAFLEGLRRAYGRIPTAGFPHISRLPKGYSRFAVFDPSGTTLLFISRAASDVDYAQFEQHPGQSRLANALVTAIWLRDLKGHDDVAAARVLDVALARPDAASAPALDRARALAARVELAVALGDLDHASSLRAELQQLTPTLTDTEREQYDDELHAADNLERLLAV